MWLNLDVLAEAWLGPRGVRAARRAGTLTLALLAATLAVRACGCQDTGPPPVAGVRVLDIDTGERFTIRLDETFTGWPVRAPRSGRISGYPAEICRSRRCRNREDGGPGWVVMHTTLGRRGPTRCLVCGSVVHGRHVAEEPPVG